MRGVVQSRPPPNHRDGAERDGDVWHCHAVRGSDDESELQRHVVDRLNPY